MDQSKNNNDMRYATYLYHLHRTATCVDLGTAVKEARKHKSVDPRHRDKKPTLSAACAKNNRHSNCSVLACICDCHKRGSK